MKLLKKIVHTFLPIKTGISKINRVKNNYLIKLSQKKHELHQKRVDGKNRVITTDNKKYICLNCNAEFIGKYCFNCGQEANTDKLTWVSVIHSMLGGITNIASGFGFTMIELFTRPGYMINDFIRGKRVSYVGPFQMLFVLAAVYAVSHQLLYPQNSQDKEKKEKIEKIESAVSVKEKPESTINKDIINGINTTTEKELRGHIADKANVAVVVDPVDSVDVIDDLTNRTEKISDIIIDFIKDRPFLEALTSMLLSWGSTNKALSAILFLPLITLGTKWAFIKSKYNPVFTFVEMLFVCSYMSCQLLIIYIIFLPFNNSSWYDSLLITMKILISLWTLHELFRNKKRSTLLKYILSRFYAYLIIVLIGAFIILILLGITYLVK